METCAVNPGTSSCPCLNSSAVARLTANVTYALVGGSIYSAFGPGSTYGPHYGLGCMVHDLHVEPYCTPKWCSDGEIFTRWRAPSQSSRLQTWSHAFLRACCRRCGEPWCWVDAQQCEEVPEPSRSFYFDGQANLFYSYETCSGTNVFDSYYITQIAPKPPPQANTRA